jgi:hypothetical protein
MLSVANKTIKLNVALPSVVMVNVVRLDVVAPRLKLFFSQKVKKNFFDVATSEDYPGSTLAITLSLFVLCCSKLVRFTLTDTSSLV